MKKTALIIGATSGIGRMLAHIFIKKGYNLIITGRRIDLLKEIQKQDTQNIHAHPLDISVTEDLSQQLDLLSKVYGRIDIIIHCAGIGTLNKELNTGIELETIQTNVSGFTIVASWCMQYFQSTQSGHLVVITSVGGLRGGDAAPAYNASKGYQINYLEGLRKRNKKLKLPIDITDVRAGLVDTDMAKGDGLFWVAPVSKAALQIANAIIKKKKIVYVTRRWRLVALFLRLIPRSLYLKI